jgi:hypothetical protein
VNVTSERRRTRGRLKRTNNVVPPRAAAPDGTSAIDPRPNHRARSKLLKVFPLPWMAMFLATATQSPSSPNGSHDVEDPLNFSGCGWGTVPKSLLNCLIRSDEWTRTTQLANEEAMLAYMSASVPIPGFLPQGPAVVVGPTPWLRANMDQSHSWRCTPTCTSRVGSPERLLMRQPRLCWRMDPRPHGGTFPQGEQGHNCGIE